MKRNLLFLEGNKEIARVIITYEQGEKPIAKFVQLLETLFDQTGDTFPLEDFELVK